MQKWGIVKTEYGYVPIPDFDLRCPFCGDRMLLHRFFASYSVSEKIYHFDVHVKCIYCSFYAIFGVPCDRETVEKLQKSSLCGKIINREVALKLSEYYHVDTSIVEKRLKALGYW